MTKAEEAALEAYPKDRKGVLYDLARKSIQQGYEQAEKDTIERAIVWLKENADSYIVDLTPTYPDAPQNIIIGGMCWEHLKQALEDEK